MVLLAKAAHSNIVKFYGFCQKGMVDPALNEDYVAFYILTERMDKNLKEEIRHRRRQKSYFSLEEIQIFLSQIIPVLIHLRNLEISQCSCLSPKNIGVKMDVFKLVDLSTARNLYGSDFTIEKTSENHLSYFSPEKLDSFAKNLGKFNDSRGVSDVFTLGLILLKMLTFSKIKGLNGGNQMTNTISSKISELSKIYKNQNLAKILADMLIVDPTKRRTFEEITSSSEYKSLFSPPQLSSISIENKGNLSSMDIRNLEKTVQKINKGMNAEQEIKKLLELAEKQRKKCEFQKSLESFEEALSFKKAQNLDNWNNDILASDILFGMGHVCIELGNYKRGLDEHENALNIRLKILGGDNKAVADSYNSLGVGFHSMGNYQKGLEYFEKALRIYEKLYGKTI